MAQTIIYSSNLEVISVFSNAQVSLLLLQIVDQTQASNIACLLLLTRNYSKVSDLNVTSCQTQA